MLYAADINPNLFQNQLLDLNFKPVDGVLPSKVEEIRRNALEELALNESEFARQKSKPVLYGSIIQLCNVYSNDYMAVNARDTYGHESWAVFFQKFARKDCFFRVMPKLRIRAKGEPVRAGDAVVFQSIKTEGFLGFHKQITENSPLKRENSTRLGKTLGLSIESDNEGIGSGNDPLRSRHSSLENVSKGWHEVCISSQPHGWTICHFESPSKFSIQKPMPINSNNRTVNTAPSTDVSGDKNILKAGSYIRLYHKEKQGYVNAFKDLTGQDLLYHEQVQLADYSFDPLNPQETTSATTFWQVEHKFPFQGTPISWNQPVRLRHAALNAYLHIEQVSSSFSGSRDNLKPGNVSESNKSTVFGDYFVTLRSNPGNSSNCLFMFVPVTASTSNVTIGTHVRIQHVGSGCWLSTITSRLNRNRHMESSSFVNSTKKPALSKIGANLNFNESFKGPGPLMLNVTDKDMEQTDQHVLTATTLQHADDYFAISDVETELAENFRYIHSMIPAVERFLCTSRKGERDAIEKQTERTRESDFVDSEKFPITKEELSIFKGVIVSWFFFWTNCSLCYLQVFF